MGQTCKIIAYRMFRSTALAAETKTTKWRRYPSSPTELRWSQSDLNVKTIEIVRTPKTSLSLAGLALSRGPRDVQMITNDIVREARRISFSLNYANYAGIFNHRSMEKDKLLILDVWGAYGQKDIEILDRSGPARLEINNPACDNGGR